MSKPAHTAVADPLTALTAPGTPFEIGTEDVRGVPCRVFKQAPQCLGEVYASAGQFADRPFLVYEGQRLSYAEAFERAASLARELAARYDVGPGTRVAIAMRNCPEWILSFLAASSLGAVAVLVNSRGSAEEIVHALESTSCELLIADPRRAQSVRQSGLDIPMIVTGEAEGEVPSLEALCTAHRGATLPMTSVPTDEAAMILFTSGTTGRSKAAVLSHRGAITALWNTQLSGMMLGVQIAAQKGVDLATLAAHQPQPCQLLVYPLFHTSGTHTVLLGSLVRGGKIVIMRRWDTTRALELIQQERITTVSGAPTMLWDLVNAPERGRYDLSSLVSLAGGGQAMPQNLLRAMASAFSECLFGGGWGQTETNGVVTMGVGPDFLAHPRASGKAAPTSELRIVDAQGHDLPPGEPGDIWVRSASNMIGYWNNPEANAAVFEAGWLKTGDIGYLDAEGRIYIVDRKKDMVISGGENIYCAEIERVLTEHPGVFEAAALGVPDERLGERLVAVVVPHADHAIGEEEICRHVREHLADYKVPRRVLLESQAFARNSIGKIDKAELRRRLGSRLLE
jgi:acyl-CoA synthetase (AMP-forming)/AMP-acid ligase II